MTGFSARVGSWPHLSNVAGFGEAVGEVPGWPEDRPIRALVAWRGWVCGSVDADGGMAVWRSDGDRVEMVAPPRPGWIAVHIATGTGDL